MLRCDNNASFVKEYSLNTAYAVDMLRKKNIFLLLISSLLSQYRLRSRHA